MSINKMLIDATHPEETRVVVLREGRVEEFDYESAARKLLRGSIYLAKITRVEPSLQAAFVDYGGNRHGFLAFSEIHPDYYQIPHADKLALLEQEQRDHDDDEEHETDADLDIIDDHEDTDIPVAANANDTPKSLEDVDDNHDFEAHAIDVTDLIPDAADQASEEADSPETVAQPETTVPLDVSAAAETVVKSDVLDTTAEPSVVVEPDDIVEDETHVHITADDKDDSVDDAIELYADSDEDDNVESFNDDKSDDDDVIELADSDDIDDTDDADEDDDTVIADDAETSRPRRRRSPRQSKPRRRVRHYKIQEVIKRRQIVLIQVVKEERGNKGAALTTYLSLAGRYTVLMPNTARGGGISRKITNAPDRKRLKAIAQELEVPEGMGLIIRTAGAARNKQEIKRDFEYLLRLWESVRNLTLESSAPSLVYEEGNLIKRSIRDLYTKEIDEVVVAGETAYKEAKGFMKMLMPSHAKNVVRHEDSQSLFARYRIEPQLNAMFSPNVQLKSGGYLVINQTEALVAVDVNSGKATREFSIEETALKTNLEAAEEVTRQLKLRDLAGLVVVDFIDMEEKRNNRAVERRLKDCLRADRARIQVGRISHFGLLEMSRQRLRTGVLEGSTMPCAHCLGSGIIRSTESVSLAVLRAIEDALVSGKATSCVANAAPEVALYLLNQKRPFLQHLEERYGVLIYVRASDKHQGANFAIDPLHDAGDRARPVARDAVNIDTGFQATAANDDDANASGENRPRRRRRRRGGRRDETQDNGVEAANSSDDQVDETDDAEDNTEQTAAADNNQSSDEGEDRPRRSRRRGRRGGRRHRERLAANGDDVSEPGAEQPAIDDGSNTATDDSSAQDTVTAAHDAPPASNGADANGNADIADLRTNEPADAVSLEQSSDEPVSLGSEAPTEDAAPSLASQMETLDEPAPSNGKAKDTPEADTDTKQEPAFANGNGKAPPAEQTAAENGSGDTADKPDRSARSQPVASEPVIQRVVVGPDGTEPSNTVAADNVASEETAKPARRGWWQRP